MSELTLLQKAMRVVEEHEPSLFDVHTNKGRDFIRHMARIVDEYDDEMSFKLEDDTMFMDSLTTEIRNLEQEGNQ
jgi:hypothetical protein